MIKGFLFQLGKLVSTLTGPRSAVEAVLQALEMGPGPTWVSRVDVCSQPAEDMRDFEIT